MFAHGGLEKRLWTEGTRTPSTPSLIADTFLFSPRSVLSGDTVPDGISVATPSPRTTTPSPRTELLTRLQQLEVFPLSTPQNFVGSITPSPPPCVTLTCVVDQESQDLAKVCLRSLYADQIRPLQNDVLRRLQEHGASPFLQQNFLKVYEAQPREYVLVHTSGTIGIYFTVSPPGFEGWVDPNDSSDPFPEPVWRGLLEHIACLLQHAGGPGARGCRAECPNLGRHQFKGGRYGMAVEMARQKLPFLKGLTLGRICQLTQLAITRGILAYERSVLQPVAAVRKAACAAVSKVDQRKDLGCTSYSASPGATIIQPPDSAWSSSFTVIREHVQEVLGERPNGYILSRLNRELWSRFSTKIDPTAFGFTKMSDFLRSEGMREICRVSVNNRNHVIVQSRRYRLPESFVPLTSDSRSMHLAAEYWTSNQEAISWTHWMEFACSPKVSGEDVVGDLRTQRGSGRSMTALLLCDEEDPLSQRYAEATMAVRVFPPIVPSSTRRSMSWDSATAALSCQTPADRMARTCSDFSTQGSSPSGSPRALE